MQKERRRVEPAGGVGPGPRAAVAQQRVAHPDPAAVRGVQGQRPGAHVPGHARPGLPPDLRGHARPGR